MPSLSDGTINVLPEAVFGPPNDADAWLPFDEEEYFRMAGEISDYMKWDGFLHFETQDPAR